MSTLSSGMLALAQPTSVFSVNGVLETSIHIQPTTHIIEPNALMTGGSGLEFITRSLNGTLPGPTLYVNPGDTLIINFYNDLVAGVNDVPYTHNELSAPNESNLHFHVSKST